MKPERARALMSKVRLTPDEMAEVRAYVLGWADDHAERHCQVAECATKVSWQIPLCHEHFVELSPTPTEKKLRDLLRRSYVNGCKVDHLQDDSIDAEVYEAFGVGDEPMPLSTLARQIEEAKGGDERGQQ